MTHPEREDGQRRRAALLLLPLFLVGASLCLWSLFANVTLGEAESFIAAPLHSSALANYGQDPLGGRLQNLSIRIIEFAIRDREPEAGDAGARATEVIEGMKSPVPTVTPKPGDPTATPPPTQTQIPHTLVPATGTPTSTSTPVPTRTPSASPTDPSTADPIATPTKTPTPSKTPTESNTATPSSSPTTTKTPTPSNTPTSSSSPTTTKTPTPSNTPTPCKVTPVVYVELPADGAVYGPGTQIEGRAHAWDPDNVNPSNCAPTPEVDGSGIEEVELQVKWIVTPVPITVYTRTELMSKYCAFSGDGSCNTVSVNGGVWPNSTPIAPGQYELWARAKDDEGQYSAWAYTTFTIILPPTATPTSLPPTSTSTSLPPSATPTPLPPSATPTPG